MLLISIIFVVILAAIPPAISEELPPECVFWRPPQKKLIEFSWNSPDPKYLREHIREMEERTPYQGLGIYLEAPGTWEGKPFTCGRGTVFGPIPWKYEWFAQAIDDLKHTEFHAFTDNFIRTNSCPGNIDWFSDSDFAAVCNNFQIYARIARECGFKGLSLDIEGYEAPVFIYDPASGHTLAETRRMVRKRGQQWANAVFGEFPNMVLFCFFWLSDTYPKYRDIGRPGDPSLTPYFINGVYDVLPPTVRIIDGHETMGYSANNLEKYLQIRQDLNHTLLHMVDVANIEKARRQTQIAPSFYLDPYFLGPNVGWASNLEWDKYPDRAHYFARNLRYAIECTEEYLWTWGEKGSWWRTVPAPGREREAINGKYSWESHAPGVTALIRDAMMQEEVYEAQLKELTAKLERNGKNLLTNASFDSSLTPSKDATPTWDFWHAQSKEFDTKRGWLPDGGINNSPCIFIQDAMNACWLQGQSAQCFETYYFKVRAKYDDAQVKPFKQKHQKANGLFQWETTIAPSVNVRIRWQDGNKGWNNVHHDKIINFGQPEADGWRTAEGTVIVPSKSEAIIMLLQAIRVKGKVLFDDATLIRLK